MAPDLSIEVAGQMKFSEIYRGSLRTTLHATRYILVPFLAVAAFSLTAQLYEMISGNRDSAFSYWGGVCSSALYAAPFLLVFIFLIPFVRSRTAYKAEQGSGLRRYIFSPDGIVAETPLGNANVKWEAYRYVIEAPAMFLLYAQASFANIIPKRCFKSDGDIAAFRTLAKEKLPKSKLRKA